MKLIKKYKNLLIVLVLAGMVVGGWAIWYVFYKPHRDVGGEKPAFTVTSEQLSSAFSSDPNAMTTYIDKAILIEGTVTAVDATNLSIGNIICNFEEANVASLKNVTVGEKVKVQGRVSTYNDLMDEIVIDKTVIK
jgi:hypothetical protein